MLRLEVEKPVLNRRGLPDTFESVCNVLITGSIYEDMFLSCFIMFPQ